MDMAGLKVGVNVDIQRTDGKMIVNKSAQVAGFVATETFIRVGLD